LFRYPLAGHADSENARFDTKKARFTAYRLGELHSVCTRPIVAADTVLAPAILDGS
jgi:hypothetical protein